jgi:hypothetical protein
MMAFEIECGVVQQRVQAGGDDLCLFSPCRIRPDLQRQAMFLALFGRGRIIAGGPIADDDAGQVAARHQPVADAVGADQGDEFGVGASRAWRPSADRWQRSSAFLLAEADQIVAALVRIAPGADGEYPLALAQPHAGLDIAAEAEPDAVGEREDISAPACSSRISLTGSIRAQSEATDAKATVAPPCPSDVSSGLPGPVGRSSGRGRGTPSASEPPAA